MFYKILGLTAVVVCLCLHNSPAEAAFITEALENVSVAGNPSENISGYYTVNSVTDQITTYSFTANGFPFAIDGAQPTYSPVYLNNGNGFGGGFSPTLTASGFSVSVPSCCDSYELTLEAANLTNFASTSPVPVGVMLSVTGRTNQSFYATGQLVVSAVPLPPSLSMFLLGLVGLGGFGWYQRRGGASGQATA